MTTLDPDAIERREREARRLADAATKGPWQADGYHVMAADHGIDAPYIVAKRRNCKPNAAFIAFCRLGVPALCDDIKALREALAERDKRLAEADAVIQFECDDEDGSPADHDLDDLDRWEIEAIARHRARQEAKPHE